MGQGAGAASVEYLVHSPMIRSQLTIQNYGEDDECGGGYYITGGVVMMTIW